MKYHHNWLKFHKIKPLKCCMWFVNKAWKIQQWPKSGKGTFLSEYSKAVLRNAQVSNHTVISHATKSGQNFTMQTSAKDGVRTLYKPVSEEAKAPKLRLTIEKAWEFQKDLYFCFICCQFNHFGSCIYCICTKGMKLAPWWHDTIFVILPPTLDMPPTQCHCLFNLLLLNPGVMLCNLKKGTASYV